MSEQEAEPGNNTPVETTPNAPSNIEVMHWPQSQDELRRDRQSLQQIADLLKAQADQAIAWYQTRKAWPRLASIWSRRLAILFVVLGGLTPIVLGLTAAKSIGPIDIGQLGYLSFALAGAAVLADRYGGYSKTWMRYMRTGRALQATLDRFQLDWLIWRTELDDEAISGEQLELAVGLLRKFQGEIGQQIDQEFQEWVVQFTSEMSELQDAISRGRGERSPQNTSPSNKPPT